MVFSLYIIFHDVWTQFWRVSGNSRNIGACAKLGPNIPMNIMTKQRPAPVVEECPTA